MRMDINIKEKMPTAGDMPVDIAKYIVAVLDAKKASNIKLLHVEEQTSIADYFVVASGNSRTQLRALADEIDFRLEGSGITAVHTEGYDTGEWVLKDYGSVIVHLFSVKSREFYNLEKLYDGTSNVNIDELVSED